MDPSVDNWLRREDGGGNKHCVFLSYPRNHDSETTRCARTIARAIRAKLGDYRGLEPCDRVFVDEECIRQGTWQPQIERALCQSMVMIAVCAPIYYDRDKPFCGREFNSMSLVGQHRLAPTIVPVLVRKSKRCPLPRAISELQYIDVVAETLNCRDYHRRPPFLTKMNILFDRVVDVANQLYDSRARAHPSPNEFRIGEESAFDDYDLPDESMPLRGMR